MHSKLPSAIDTDWYAPYRHSGKCPLKTVLLMLGFGIAAGGIVGVAGYYGGVIPVFLGKIIFGLGGFIGEMKGGATGKIGFTYVLPFLFSIFTGFLYAALLGILPGSFIGSVGKAGKCRNVWLAGAIACVCGIVTYGTFVWLTMKLGGGLHETSHLTKLIDLPSDSVWMFLIVGVDALVVIGSSIGTAVSNISKTPFCEKCNEWYLNPIKGNYPSEIAPGLTDALETGDPRKIPTFQPILPNVKDPHITIELQKCACEQGDFRLATSLHWRESKKKDGQVKVEDKGEVWFATMISPGFGRQLGARLFDMHSQPANPDATAKASLPLPISESAPTEPSADTVAEKSKKCPICDNEINADARLCNCCGAEFEISVQGYCATCHQIMNTDANNCCHICGTSLVDIHTTSEYVRPDAQINRASIPGNLSTAPSVQTHKKSIGSTWARVAGISLVLVGACLFVFKSLQFNIPLFTATATETPRPTRTHIPTPRATATRTQLPTSTPLPIEITFDDIDNFPVGRSVILVGRLALMSSTTCSLSECCLVLENPASPSQTLPIFVTVGSKTNQMKPLPNPYTKSDIQVQLDDGTFAVVGYRIRVTGRVCSTVDKEPCISEIIRIELFQLK